MSRSRGWCFTDNECKEDVWTSLECSYVVFGRETAPTTGQAHLQGFVYFPTLKSFKAVKKLAPSAHWEAAVGTPAQASDYCKKEGDFVERGTLPVKGARTDLHVACELVKAGASDRELCESNPVTYARYSRGLHAVRSALLLPRCTPPIVHWFHGRTGTGKSWKAHEMAGPSAYVKPMDTTFWEGYTGQSKVILDDLRPSSMAFDQLLRVLDRYPLLVNIKGSSCQFCATEIWITAPTTPHALFVNHSTGAVYENIDQLVRRITNIQCFDPVEPPLILND